MNHIMRKVDALKKRGYLLPRWGGHSTRKMVTGAVTGASLIKSSLPSQEVTYRQFLIIPKSSRIFLPKGIFLPTDPALALGRWEVQGGKNSSSWINISCSPFSGIILWRVLHRLWGYTAGSVSMVTVHQHTLHWLSSLPCLIPSLSHCASWDYMPKSYMHPTSHPTRPWGN